MTKEGHEKTPRSVGRRLLLAAAWLAGSLACAYGVLYFFLTGALDNLLFTPPLAFEIRLAPGSAPVAATLEGGRSYEVWDELRDGMQGDFPRFEYRLVVTGPDGTVPVETGSVLRATLRNALRAGGLRGVRTGVFHLGRGGRYTIAAESAAWPQGDAWAAAWPMHPWSKRYGPFLAALALALLGVSGLVKALLALVRR